MKTARAARKQWSSAKIQVGRTDGIKRKPLCRKISLLCSNVPRTDGIKRKPLGRKLSYDCAVCSTGPRDYDTAFLLEKLGKTGQIDKKHPPPSLGPRNTHP